MKLKLFKTLILPHITYCDTIFNSATNERLISLRRAINYCLRFIYRLGPRMHITHLQSSLLGVPFANFFDYRCVLMIHKIVNNNVPNYLTKKITFGRSVRQNGLLAVRARTEHYKRSTFVRGVILWNSLPNSIRTVRSEAGFKRVCKEYFNNR